MRRVAGGVGGWLIERGIVDRPKIGVGSDVVAFCEAGADSAKR